MWWQQPTFDVVFDPTVRQAEAGTVLVGLGSGNDAAGMPGVVLNQKGLLGDRESGTRSVSEFVMHADEERVASWRSRLPGGLGSLRRIVVEDLSLDTCFALLLLGRRLSGQGAEVAGAEVGGAEDLPGAFDASAWTDYVTEWERGGYRDAEPRGSVALLVTLLAHSYLAPPGSSRQDAGRFGAGLTACLNLLDALVRSGAPSQVSVPRGLADYQRAMAQFDYEQQQYRLALEYGRRCQLMVPLAQGARRMLVDALILEEVEPGGILKVFARTDAEHTFSRRGFAVLAVYRPSQAGTGNDMTVSVDPATGLSLRDLWQELERRENAAWEGQRPADAPRPLDSYRSLDSRALLAGAPNEPWWDDAGNFTLLGAPKQLLIDAKRVPGTRLRWREDVLGALWQLYQPVPADAVSSSVTPIGNRRYALVRWAHGPNLAVAESPSFHGWLAAQSMRAPIASPLDLPRETDYQLLRIEGGLVVLHRQGLTLFDDWREASPDDKGIHKLAADVAAASRLMHDFLLLTPSPLQAALARQQELLKDYVTVSAEQLRDWRREYIEQKSRLLEVMSLGLDQSESHELAELRRQLARVWGLTEDRERLLLMLDRIDVATRDAFASVKERRIGWVTGLACAAGAGYAARKTFDELSGLIGAKESAAFVEQIHWAGNIVVVIAFVLGYLAWRRWGSKLGE